jgi:hypothetical protein
MHAVLRALESSDVGADPLEDYEPPEPAHFSLVLAAHIGADDGPGQDLFYVTVCSPSWLAEEAEAQNEHGKGFRFLRHHLLVNRWNLELVHRAVEDLCRNTSGQDWSEVANKLSRYFAWEYEDYRDRPAETSS